MNPPHLLRYLVNIVVSKVFLFLRLLVEIFFKANLVKKKKRHGSRRGRWKRVALKST
jgi:hypothetical protein